MPSPYKLIPATLYVTFYNVAHSCAAEVQVRKFAFQYLEGCVFPHLRVAAKSYDRANH